MSNMVTAPAFADLIPPRKPSLRDLANEAIICARRLNSDDLPDHQWNYANDCDFAATNAFLDALTALGLDRKLLGELTHEGIIV